VSRGAGLHRLTGGIAKREREAWERLAEGWPCPLRGCGENGIGLIQHWTGTFRPVCAKHAEQARDLGYSVLTPASQQTEED
jgi:hypothetical protein